MKRDSFVRLAAALFLLASALAPVQTATANEPFPVEVTGPTGASAAANASSASASLMTESLFMPVELSTYLGRVELQES